MRVLSAIMVLPVGFLIDKIGNRVSALLFTGIASSGSLLFALGSISSVRGTDAMFPLMMVGRLLLGAGTGPSRIVRDRILAAWFRDKLSLAFGIAVSTMGLGSVCTFVFTSNLAEWIGLRSTLFVGAGVCFTTFVSAVFVCCLDYYGEKKIARSRRFPVQIKKKSASTMKTSTYWGTIRSFSTSFWVLCIMTATYYSFQLPFIANGSKFIRERYGYKTTTSSYINGVLYDVSVVLSPVAGLMLEKIGNRAWVAFFGSLLTLPVGPLLLFTDMPPLVGFIWIGVTFTFTVVSLWSSIPHTVPHMSLGTANGVASCMLDTFCGLTSLGIGQLMKLCPSDDPTCVDDNWRLVYLVLFGHVGLCTLTGLVLNSVCGRQDPSLNERNVVARQASFGPVHVSIAENRKSSTDDLASIANMSRESSMNDLRILSTQADETKLDAFINYKATMPRGLKVKVNEGGVDQDDNLQCRTDISSKIANGVKSNCENNSSSYMVQYDYGESKAQDNIAYDMHYEDRPYKDNKS